MFSQECVQTVREGASQMECEGVLSEAALQWIYDLGLFKLFVPKEYGGRMTTLPEATRIFQAASRIDGSFGWAIAIGSGGGYFVSCLPQHISKDLFSDMRAVIAGSGAPTGEATRVEGGYLLNGAWKYCTGAPYASVYTASAVVADQEDPAILAFVLRPEQIEIVPDWRAFGLKATASHTIVAKDAFIPTQLVFQVGTPVYSNDPIYRYPFLPFAEASFASVCLGIAEHFIQEATLLLERQRHRWDKTGDSRSNAVWASIVSARNRWEEQTARFQEAVDQSWRRHVEGLEYEDGWHEVGRESKRCASVSLSCAQEIFPYLGLSAVMEDALINRIWRDLHTAGQHPLLMDI